MTSELIHGANFRKHSGIKRRVLLPGRGSVRELWPSRRWNVKCRSCTTWREFSCSLETQRDRRLWATNLIPSSVTASHIVIFVSHFHQALGGQRSLKTMEANRILLERVKMDPEEAPVSHGTVWMDRNCKIWMDPKYVSCNSKFYSSSDSFGRC